jgi:hypothetical protein
LIKNAKNGCGTANAEGKNDHRDGRETWLVAHLPQSEADILPHN